MKKPLLFLLFCTTFYLSQAMEEIPAVPPTEEAQLYEFRPLFEKHKEGIRSSIKQDNSDASCEEDVQLFRRILQMIDDPEALAAAEKAFDEPEYHATFMDFAKKTRPDASAEEIEKIMIPAWIKIRKLLFKKYEPLSSENLINTALHGEIACTVADTVGGKKKLIQKLYIESIMQDFKSHVFAIFQIEDFQPEESNSNSNSKTE